MENEPVAEAQDPIQPERHDQLPNVSSYQPGWPGGWGGIFLNALIVVMLMILSSLVTWSITTEKWFKENLELRSQIGDLERELWITKHVDKLASETELVECHMDLLDCSLSQHDSLIEFLESITNRSPSTHE